MFQSKRDGWIVALIWAGALMAVYGGFIQFTSTTPLLLRVVMLVFLVSIGAFMLWVLYAIEYSLTDEDLLIRCGPFKYRVPLAEIDSVRPSRNPLSSPAGSLDRLLIKWSSGRKRILISPLRKQEFLQELANRCEQLVLVGDSLELIEMERRGQ